MPEVYRVSVVSSLSLGDTLGTSFVSDDIHPDWVRWCYASINKYFDDRKGQHELYLEGDKRTQQDEVEFAELRIDGPSIKRLARSCFYLNVEINVLCATHLDPRHHYTAQKMVGIFTKIFTNNIPVYKYGDGPFDDSSLLGCFRLLGGGGEAVDVNYFGIIKSDTKLLQTSIEGHYRLEL